MRGAPRTGPSWRSLWELHDRVERIFRELSAPPAAPATLTPPTEVAEDEQAYWVSFDLPGVPADQLTLRVKQGVLWLAGHKPAPPAEGPVLRGERRYGRIAASVPLPREADPADIGARLAQGVLTVRIGRRAAGGDRHIPIEYVNG